jgi:hypothetical protein
MNNMSLLFFSDMCLPYAFYFYLSKHKFTCKNTRVTKHMLNMPLPRIYNMSNMQFMHVYITFSILFKSVVSGCNSLASH